MVKSDFFYPLPFCISVLPHLAPNWTHTHTHMCTHTNTVYYAVTLPDPLRQLCISVWLMRVISPKQQNDHFGGERHTDPPSSPVFPLLFFFLAYKKGKKKKKRYLVLRLPQCLECSSGDKQLSYAKGKKKVITSWIQSIYRCFDDDSRSNPANKRHWNQASTLPVGAGGVGGSLIFSLITTGIQYNTHATVN